MASLGAAATCAAVYPALQLVNAQIAQVTAAIANSATLAGGSQIGVNDPVTGPYQFTMAAAGLTVAESATVFNAMLTILQARQTALTATITGVS